MSIHAHTRTPWEAASQKHVREYAEHLEQARTWRLLPIEEEVLGPLLPGKGALIWLEDLDAWAREHGEPARPPGLSGTVRRSTGRGGPVRGVPRQFLPTRPGLS